MSLEDQLKNWTGPSSATEQDKQDRTERMICDAIERHAPFDDANIRVFAKGSYANNTNVRADSDVDIAVECRECIYWKAQDPDSHEPGSPYKGEWTPDKLRQELVAALTEKFGGDVDTGGSVAIGVNSSSARVDADVVPCFTYRYYFANGGYREGTKIFTTSGSSIENFPKQQLENGRAKNSATNYAYKKTVRILKRVENAMYDDGAFKELPSYFIECLAYNCPNDVFERESWTDVVKAALFRIWDDLQGEEPEDADDRWVEANDCFYLFHGGQEWSREDGRGFAKAAWNYLGFADE